MVNSVASGACFGAIHELFRLVWLCRGSLQSISVWTYSETCSNRLGNRTSPSDNSNDRWKRLCLVSWATAPCVWTL